MIFKSTKKMVMYCYVDSDVSGLYRYEDPQGPICKRSRKINVINISN